MKTYWLTWGVLLAFTVVMLWADAAPIPRMVFVVFDIHSTIGNPAGFERDLSSCESSFGFCRVETRHGK